MKIFLATWLEHNQGVTLTKARAKNRLMSYFFIKDDLKNFDIREYVRRGKIREKKRQRSK
jgi:hypothetical protein